MVKYQIKHLIFLVLGIMALGFVLLWIFNKVIIDPVPNEEFYLLILIYTLMFFITAFVYKTTNFTRVNQYIGVRSFELKYIIWAVLLALSLWIVDFIYQQFFLQADVADQANKWYLNNRQNGMFITFLTTAILAPVIEEMLLRGIFLQTINRHLSLFWTALIISGLFAFIHFEPMQIPPLFIASVIYIVLTFYSKSIIPAIIAHILNNSITFFYYISLLQ